MASSNIQIDKPQRGCPERAELLDVNINTGTQSINTQRASLDRMPLSLTCACFMKLYRHGSMNTAAVLLYALTCCKFSRVSVPLSVKHLLKRGICTSTFKRCTLTLWLHHCFLVQVCQDTFPATFTERLVELTGFGMLYLPPLCSQVSLMLEGREREGEGGRQGGRQGGRGREGGNSNTVSKEWMMGEGRGKGEMVN